MNTCVFCLEGAEAERPLLYNVKCRCNFHFHLDCYEVYDKKTKCPLCRGHVGHLYSPPMDTYIEFVQPPSAPPQSPPPQSNRSVIVRQTGGFLQREMCIIIFGLIVIIAILTGAVRIVSGI